MIIQKGVLLNLTLLFLIASCTYSQETRPIPSIKSEDSEGQEEATIPAGRDQETIPEAQPSSETGASSPPPLENQPAEDRLIEDRKEEKPFLKTEDGLELGLSTDGNITELKMDGYDLYQPDTESGFYLSDFSRGTPFVPVVGDLQKKDNKLTLNSNVAALNTVLEAKFVAKNDHIVVDAEVTSTQPQERAYQLCFKLPVKGEKWGNAIRDSHWHQEFYRVNEKKKEYFTHDDLQACGDPQRKFSSLPMSTLYQDNYGISLAVPPFKPRLFRLSYDSNNSTYNVCFDLGTSPVTKNFPNSAEASFVIYKNPDPSWGLRSSVAKYYTFFPEAARQWKPKGGTWVSLGYPGLYTAQTFKHLAPFDVWGASTETGLYTSSNDDLLATKLIGEEIGESSLYHQYVQPTFALLFYDGVSEPLLRGEELNPGPGELQKSLERIAAGKCKIQCCLEHLPGGDFCSRWGLQDGCSNQCLASSNGSPEYENRCRDYCRPQEAELAQAVLNSLPKKADGAPYFNIFKAGGVATKQWLEVGENRFLYFYPVNYDPNLSGPNWANAFTTHVVKRGLDENYQAVNSGYNRYWMFLNARRSTEENRQGTASLLFSFDTREKKPFEDLHTALARRVFALEKNKIYRLEFWAKITEGLKILANSGIFLKKTERAYQMGWGMPLKSDLHDWKQYSQKFILCDGGQCGRQIPPDVVVLKTEDFPGQTQLAARVEVYGQKVVGKAYFDDLALIQTETGANLLSDGGFEEEGLSNVGIDGIAFDSFECNPSQSDLFSIHLVYGLSDFDRSHWENINHPLSIDYETKGPALFTRFAWYDYVEKMAREMHSKGKSIFPNGGSSDPFLAPLIDMAGTELNEDSAFGTVSYESAMLINYRKAIHHDWVVSLKKERVVDHLNLATFYGAFFGSPLITQEQYRTPEIINAFQTLTPIANRLYRAGWEPVTFAKSDQEDIFLERFGNSQGGKLYLSLLYADSTDWRGQTEKQATKKARITIQKGVLGLGPQASFREIVSNRPIQILQNDAQELIFETILEKRRVAVLELRP